MAARLIEKSRAVHELGEINGKKIVYSGLRRVLLALDPDQLSKIEAGAIETDIGLHLDEFDAAKAMENYPRNMAVAFFPTTDCNLACIYCYAKGGDNPDMIDLDMAKVAFDSRIEQMGLDSVWLSFHGGGEPTMALDFIIDIVEYARTKVDVKVDITSNGVWNERTTNWIIENVDKISISADGPPDIQDYNRPTRNGEGSSRCLERTINALVDNNKNFGVRTTVSEKHVDRINDILDYFKGLGVPGVRLEPIFETGRALEAEYRTPGQKAFIENYLGALEYANEIGIKLSSTFLDLSRSSCKFCGGADSIYGVTVDGFISACYESFRNDEGPFVYGSIDVENNTVEIDEDKLAYLNDRHIANMPYCDPCIAKYQCRGSCPMRSYEVTGDIYEPNSESCKVKQDLMVQYFMSKAKLFESVK